MQRPSPISRITSPGRFLPAILILLLIAAATLGNAMAQGQDRTLTTTVPENAPAGTSLGTPMETTAPAGTVSYSLSGPDAGLFNIDPATGEITLAQGASPDYETRASYSVTITASANLVVSVDNLDEPGTVSLSTGSPRSGEALNASLTDPDGSVSALSWRWQRSTEEGWEDIADATAPDYTPGAGDVGSRLRAVATYDDGSGQGRTAQAATAEPVRNDPPEFGADAANLAVDENTAPGALVGSPITASDPNGDDVSYSLTGSGEFTVDPRTGQIRVSEGAALDHEATATHSLTLRAEDAHGDHDEISVTVRVNNLEEAGTLTLSHGDLRAGSVLTASLEDPDGSVSGESWQWNRASNPISGATGSSYTVTTGDVGHVLNVSVSYTDGHGPGKSASVATGSAVGNDAPAFPAQTISREIDENATAGTAAGDPVTATDPNGDPLAYSMTGTDAFSINRNTGVISANSPMDHESQARYTVTVTATDVHGATAQAEVTIAVNNLDEPGAVSLSNTAPRAGDTIAASLTDPDGETSNETWQWRRDGSDITGATSDSYTADAEDLGHTLSVTVSYEDPQGPGKSAQASADAPVSNDPPTFDAAGPVAMTVPEDAPTGTNVGEPLAATDPNDDTLAFALTGDGARDFTVDDNGQITVASALDHESRSSYSLTATVSDPAGGSDSTPVNITVDNAEEPGVVVLGAGNQPQVGSEIAASLSDPDGGVNGESWQWQSSDSETGPWNDVAGSDSASYTPQKGDIDRYLRAVVTYRDGHGTGQDTAQATTGLPVKPEPNRPPAFLDSLTTTFNISINVREGVRVAPPFTATDPNDDTLTYSIVPGTPEAFTINPATGEVLMGSLEMTEGATFTASISVTDGLDDAGREDHSPDDTLDLAMTIVNPNIVIEPSSRAAFPRGLWVDDDIVVTTNDIRSYSRSDQAMIYDRATQQHLEDRSFRVGGRSYPSIQGVWSDGTTLYVLAILKSRSTPGGKIFAYRLSDGGRRSSKDIILPSENSHPYGLTARGGVMYVGDNRDDKVYAYDIESGSRQSERDINGIDTLRRDMTDLWLDGDTIWVSYWLSDFIRAYDVATGERKPDLDVQLARENAGPSGIDSDGFNLWALDSVNDTIYGYVLPQ